VNKPIFFIVSALLIALFSAIQSSAGNLSLIEKRLIEMDQLNKQAVQQAGKIPQNGSVEIKARVTPLKPMGKDAGGSSEKSFQFGQKTIMSIDQTSPYTIQISSSRSQDQCYRVAAMLRRAGYPAFTASLMFKDQTVWHRIFVGSFINPGDAETTKQALKEDDISDDALVRSMPYAIQVGSFGSIESLSPVRQQVEQLKYLPYTSYARDTANDENKARLLVGAFESREETASLVAQLREQGLDVRVVTR